MLIDKKMVVNVQVITNHSLYYKEDWSLIKVETWYFGEYLEQFPIIGMSLVSKIYKIKQK